MRRVLSLWLVSVLMAPLVGCHCFDEVLRFEAYKNQALFGGCCWGRSDCCPQTDPCASQCPDSCSAGCPDECASPGGCQGCDSGLGAGVPYTNQPYMNPPPSTQPYTVQPNETQIPTLTPSPGSYAPVR